MRIGIVGLGLIGGSLALALQAKEDYTVLGVSRQAETCRRAIERGLVQAASTDLSLLRETDLVVICTPLALIVPTLQQLIPYLSANTVVTDVGSVKAEIVSAVAPLWTHFIGGHPMAGTAESGLEAAQPGLFVDRPYVLTPTATTSDWAVNRLVEMVQGLQAKLYFCSPEEHDRAVAWISHLPVMVSAGLIQACLQESQPKLLQLAQQLASSGFRDTSRVGGGNPELGVMMARYNRAALLVALDQYRLQIEQIMVWIEEQRWSELLEYLEVSQRQRQPFVE